MCVGLPIRARCESSGRIAGATSWQKRHFPGTDLPVKKPPSSFASFERPINFNSQQSASHETFRN